MIELIALVLLVIVYVIAHLIDYFKKDSKDPFEELNNTPVFKAKIIKNNRPSKAPSNSLSPIVKENISIPAWKTYTGTLMYMPADLKADYMRSVEWAELKELRMQIANHTCEVEGCTETEHLHLHHVDYARLTQEDIEDVRLLCPVHHNKKHKELGKDRATKYPID